MNQEQYRKLLRWCRQNKKREKVMTILCKYSPISVMFVYATTLIYLALNDRSKLLTIIIFPVIALSIITIIRKVYNQPRPVQIYDIDPLIKHHDGESFPSRHTGSATIIAYSMLYVNLYLGILCFLIAIYVGISRIVAGVHFVRDVLAGALISTIVGLVMFII